jgi:hypothetical protein
MNEPPFNTQAYIDTKRAEERIRTLYRVASICVWLPRTGSHTIAVLWPKGETADQIARRFVDEAGRKFGRAFALGRWDARINYEPPLGCVFAMVHGREGN